MLWEDFGPESDVDVLVEFLPEKRVGFFRLRRIERELTALLGVRKVDLRTPGDLSTYFSERFLSRAEDLYER